MKFSFSFILIFFGLNFQSSGQIIDGYTDQQSYRAGETVTFFINGDAPDYGNFDLLDMNGSVITTISGFESTLPQYPITSEPWKDGYGYSATNTWTVPSTLNSGFYLLDGKIPVIIKGNKSSADVIIICPTNTINAYTTGYTHINSEGNTVYEEKSLYPDKSSPRIAYPDLTTVPFHDGEAANTVSFLRPQDFHESLMEGFMNWMSTENIADNYNISVIADFDMEDYSEIENAKLLIIIGHSEYWTRNARMNFDLFVDSGKDALVLSGNTMYWQVRYSDDNTQLICYKNDAGTDPPDTRLSEITQNMIDLLVAGSEIFVSTAPTKFSMGQGSGVVSYSACTSTGKIQITPCGVYLNDGFKVDMYGRSSAKLEGCTSCRMGAGSNTQNTNPNSRFALNSENKNYNLVSENNTGEKLSSFTEKRRSAIVPNPNSGQFTLLIPIENPGTGVNEIKIYTVLGETIYEARTENIVTEGTNLKFEIDLKNRWRGIYFIKVQSGAKSFVQKLVIE